MSEIRARVDAIVTDQQTAQRLKAWYRQLCKRPCFHDEYLGAYNLPSVHLVDTDGQGVERITPAGVVAAGVEYPVDCIIYASGFEVGTEATRRYGFDMTGRDGTKLSDHWSGGMRSMHGVHVYGFPNAFHVQLWQGGNVIANVPHNLTDSAKTIAAVVSHMADHGFDVAEVTKEAEDAWMELPWPHAQRHRGSGRAEGWERLTADVCLAVGDEPRQRLVQGVERAVPRRVREYLAGAGDAGGDAAEGVLAGDLGVLGSGAAGELVPVDEVQDRLAAEPPRHAGRQAPLRHRLLGDHVEAGPDRRRAGQRALEGLRHVVGVHVMQDAKPVIGQGERPARRQGSPGGRGRGSRPG